MKIIKIKEKHRGQYEDFVKSHPFCNIHQSYRWAEFQKKIPGREEAWILAVLSDKDEYLGSALVYKNQLPFNLCWLYCPRGPLIDFVDEEVFKMLLNGIREIAKEENAIFLRIDPPVVSWLNNCI